ncbi:hypothetical protein JP75_14285 [Devosia riboflavina]|uniref:Uncharacterized protein n=1 Tax=Devosia riboflavina TaxID=46914 RepID=A0A087M186_9HYPH|nr:hypothetical protein [Devosia riboflavina]KFL30639.1 hypothetical protein JP75_14285 [Devosia riboflavina]
MAFAIGLRVYRVSITRKSDKERMTIGPAAAPCDLFAFAEQFAQIKQEPTVESEEQRTWFFEPKDTNSIRTVHGYINYGTHGFESKFKDVKTRKEKYSRQSSDLEEIPLYFQMWIPEDSEFALMAFQSFQSRSCVGFVRASMIASFEERYPQYRLNFNVVANHATFLNSAPVKSVTFHRPKTVSDRAERYFLGRGSDEVDYDLTVRARKRGYSLSTYGELKDRFPATTQGYVEFDGHQFENVTADVQIGRKRRSVGVYGTGFDAGYLDISEQVRREPSGHPVFASIESEVDEILQDFFAGMTA